MKCNDLYASSWVGWQSLRCCPNQPVNRPAGGFHPVCDFLHSGRDVVVGGIHFQFGQGRLGHQALNQGLFCHEPVQVIVLVGLA